MASWTIISQVVGLLACSLMSASALADHESSKQPPLLGAAREMPNGWRLWRFREGWPLCRADRSSWGAIHKGPGRGAPGIPAASCLR